MGKSGMAFGVGLRGLRGAAGDKGVEPGDAALPALATGGAQVGKMCIPVVGVGVSLTGGGAEKVEIDAVHGLRPVSRSGFKDAMKRGTIRIRKILGT
jgi:hypothetical protein